MDIGVCTGVCIGVCVYMLIGEVIVEGSGVGHRREGLHLDSCRVKLNDEKQNEGEERLEHIE